MRKESKVLILFSLLLANTVVVAQEDLKDEDLQSLLNDTPASSEVKEVNEPTPEATSEASATEGAPTETTAADTTAPPSEPVSSETVDLNKLEANPEGSDVAIEVPDTPKDGNPDTIGGVETLEPLPVETTPESQTPATATAPSDELENLKKDVGAENVPAETAKKEEPTVPTKTATSEKTVEPAIFDVGREERDLMAIAQNIQGQISDTQWNEVATAAKIDTYTVVKDDWLFKISKRIFGSGYYYPKIWSINSFITNPHFIEPGIVLSFTTGSGSRAPEVKLGTFSEDELNASPGSIGNGNAEDLANFGEEATPAWVDEKANLEKQGVYIQYASEETMDDVKRASEQALNKEYENYEPPRNEFDVIVPKNYDKSGFDKSSKIFYSIKEGFYLSTFLSTNIVQDFGELTDGPDENIFFMKLDHAYVKFDESMNILPGDKFSVYTSGGKVTQKNSDREGYKYSIVAQVKVVRKIKDKWEIEFTEVSGTPQRGDRITAYTPKIERITHTYNSRLIEAAIMEGYEPGQLIIGYGNVVYLDRGRADGVEMGNVFEVYGFKDRATGKNITDQPTYKLGELTVITLTDNFATALVTKSNRDFYSGDIAMTKTKEAHLREEAARKSRGAADKELKGGKALEELDVELNLENLNEDLLKEADKIQLTEDELAELERQEREKSIIKDSEKDLKALERLENEIESAENILNDAKLDEDKLLENENLNDIERKQKAGDMDAVEDIEENLGKRYIDEDLNSKDNPFGLTEFDVEEIDELLNTEKKEPKQE